MDTRTNLPWMAFATSLDATSQEAALAAALDPDSVPDDDRIGTFVRVLAPTTRAGIVAAITAARFGTTVESVKRAEVAHARAQAAAAPTPKPTPKPKAKATATFVERVGRTPAERAIDSEFARYARKAADTRAAKRERKAARKAAKLTRARKRAKAATRR